MPAHAATAAAKPAMAVAGQADAGLRQNATLALPAPPNGKIMNGNARISRSPAPCLSLSTTAMSSRVFNPLEKDAEFLRMRVRPISHGASLNGIFAPLFEGLASVLARYTFVLHSSPRPTVFWSG